MKKRIYWGCVCMLTAAAALLGAYSISRTATAMAELEAAEQEKRIVIDAGHGLPDGGATSCTERLEHIYNLEIALRLQDLMRFLGFEAVLTRTTEDSVYTEGKTIAAKKMSDLKERVRIAAESENAVLLSIHQNHFPDSQYHGAVVLYANTEGSMALAQNMQSALNDALDPGSRRRCKQADGIYLMEHITCPGILIECGFLSNWEEEEKLRDPEYQKKLCCIIGAVVSEYIAVMDT